MTRAAPQASLPAGSGVFCQLLGWSPYFGGVRPPPAWPLPPRSSEQCLPRGPGDPRASHSAYPGDFLLLRLPLLFLLCGQFKSAWILGKALTGDSEHNAQASTACDSHSPEWDLGGAEPGQAASYGVEGSLLTPVPGSEDRTGVQGPRTVWMAPLSYRTSLFSQVNMCCVRVFVWMLEQLSCWNLTLKVNQRQKTWNCNCCQGVHDCFT